MSIQKLPQIQITSGTIIPFLYLREKNKYST